MSVMEINTRVVMIGNTRTGKTSLFHKYFHSSFQHTSTPTIAPAVSTRQFVEKDMKIFVNYFDTAGQEKYRSLGQIYYRNSMAAILVFDITDRESFNDIQMWVNDYKSNSDSGMIFLAANKYDLIEKAQVTETEIADLSHELNAQFLFTSALDGFGVYELFEMVNQAVVKRVVQERVQTVPEVNLKPSNKTTKEESACC